MAKKTCDSIENCVQGIDRLHAPEHTRRTSIRIPAGPRENIWTRDLRNTKQENYSLDRDFRWGQRWKRDVKLTLRIKGISDHVKWIWRDKRVQVSNVVTKAKAVSSAARTMTWPMFSSPQDLELSILSSFSSEMDRLMGWWIDNGYQYFRTRREPTGHMPREEQTRLFTD